MLPKIRKSMLNDDGSIKKFSSTRENLLYHYLPSALQVSLPSAVAVYTTTGLYTAASSTALMAGAGLALVGTSYAISKAWDYLDSEDFFEEQKQSHDVFDFNKNKPYGDYQETLQRAKNKGITDTFVDTLHDISNKAGLKETPLVMLKKKSFLDAVNAATTNIGKKQVIYINSSFLSVLSEKEQKGVLEHEITHLADKHSQKQFIGHAAKVTLIAGGLGLGTLGALTLMPVSLMAMSTFATKLIAATAVAGVAYAALETMKSKYNEFVADRGVTLLSDADTSDYQEGLKNIVADNEMVFGKSQKLSRPQKIALSIKNETLHYIDGTHPKVQMRMDFVKASEKQYHELKEKMDTRKRAKPRTPKPSQKM